MARPNSSTAATGASVETEGMRFKSRAPCRITTMSKEQSSTRLGRRIFTATMRPSVSRALCTCDTDAEASGTGANSA